MNLIAFLGPSLPASEAGQTPDTLILPPARQGDIWKALTLRPRVIALIDGLFESYRSVWHHEILAALQEGVAVFGASSMGALRAAELQHHGMVGVGQIFRWVRDGVVVDDSDVALLHADAEFGFRPLSVPLVNVRYAAKVASERGVVTAREANAMLKIAQRIFYQDRTWPGILQNVRRIWKSSTWESWFSWAPKGIPEPQYDLKAIDARECLRCAAEFARSSAALSPPSTLQAPLASSAAVRKSRNAHRVGIETLAQLYQRPDVEELINQGLQKLLIRGWAYSTGVDPLFLAAHPGRVLPDGPSREEGLIFEARARGLLEP